MTRAPAQCGFAGCLYKPSCGGGIAAHETGHAIPHAGKLLAAAPAPASCGVQFGSFLGPLVFFLGLCSTSLAGLVGVALFGAWPCSHGDLGGV